MDAKTVWKCVLLLMLCIGCYGIDRNAKTLTIGDDREVCNKYFAVPENQTTVITSTKPINPACSIGLFGYSGSTPIFNGQCLAILDLILPCPSDSSLIVRSFHTWYDANRTLNFNDSKPLKEEVLSCNQTTPTLFKKICSFEHHLFQISVYVPNTSETSLTKIKLQLTKSEDVRLGEPPLLTFSRAPLKEMTIPTRICPSNGECLIVLPLQGHQEEEDSDSLDINNLITIIAGVCTSLLIPVVLLYIRKQLLQNTDSKTETDTVLQTLENQFTKEEE